MGICLRYAKDYDDAKDIFQDTFIKIFKQLHTLKSIDALDYWIKSITVRTAINFYYQKLNKLNNTSDNNQNVEPVSDDYLKIMDQLNNEALVKLINHMPDGYRIVFNMYVIEGYKHKEIADILDISINTSKTQLRDAKTYLKNQLKNLGIVSYEVV